MADQPLFQVVKAHSVRLTEAFGAGRAQRRRARPVAEQHSMGILQWIWGFNGIYTMGFT